jgi:hypothetical protein
MDDTTARSRNFRSFDVGPVSAQKDMTVYTYTCSAKAGTAAQTLRR